MVVFTLACQMAMMSSSTLAHCPAHKHILFGYASFDDLYSEPQIRYETHNCLFYQMRSEKRSLYYIRYYQIQFG